ncbi:hypothetical protein [Pseudomonas urmiensis]|uniref:hypothetical protein n=1 Tax=Pseudomonas urmiensis TaxID=2745493 RepID=UPI0034D3F519
MGQITELHKAYLEASSKADHFLLGAIAAACAYLAQSNPYGRIGLNPETLFLLDLVILGLAAYFAHRRIQNTVQVLKFNTTYLQAQNNGDAIEYHGSKMLASEYADRTSLDYKLRNYFMAGGFILYVIAKVWRAY